MSDNSEVSENSDTGYVIPLILAVCFEFNVSTIGHLNNHVKCKSCGSKIAYSIYDKNTGNLNKHLKSEKKGHTELLDLYHKAKEDKQKNVNQTTNKKRKQNELLKDVLMNTTTSTIKTFIQPTPYDRNSQHRINS